MIGDVGAPCGPQYYVMLSDCVAASGKWPAGGLPTRRACIVESGLSIIRCGAQALGLADTLLGLSDMDKLFLQPSGKKNKLDSEGVVVFVVVLTNHDQS